MSDGVMTYEDWLRGCVHHDGRHGYVTLPCDEVLKIADFIEKLRADRKTENCSENPNNCEHITEDGVTCAKYPACDDCLDNPLNKVKGSERLLKGKDEPQTEMTTEQIVNELLSIKKILDDGKLPKQTHEIRTNTHECVKDTHDKTGSDSEKPNNRKESE